MSLTPKTPIPKGAIRYNTDSNKMEVWIGDKWMIVSTSQSLEGVGGRGISVGGASPGSSPYARINTIEYITISTLGDAVDFGDLLTRHQEGAGLSNAHGGL